LAFSLASPSSMTMLWESVFGFIRTLIYKRLHTAGLGRRIALIA
jgi:hypothetical protein